jgi:hypothetical protein
MSAHLISLDCIILKSGEEYKLWSASKYITFIAAFVSRIPGFVGHLLTSSGEGKHLHDK